MPFQNYLMNIWLLLIKMPTISRLPCFVFFGGYGPHQHLSWWGGPQSVFIGAVLRGRPMEIHGDGSQTRSFTYITDHVDGIVRVIESERSRGEIFNLGSTREISILELAMLINRLI